MVNAGMMQDEFNEIFDRAIEREESLEDIFAKIKAELLEEMDE